MATIKKHAEFLDTLRGMVVTKEATAGKVTGKPGADTHYTSVSESTETVNKNEEGRPEKNPQEFKQEKASDPSDPTKGGKKAEAAPEAPEAKKEAAEAPKAPETTKEAEVNKEAGAVAGKANLPDTTKPAIGKTAPNTTEQTKKAEEAPAANTKLAELGMQILQAIKAANDENTKEAEAPKASGKPGADTHYTSTSESTEHVNKNQEGRPEKNPQEFKQEKAHDPSDPTKKHSAAQDQEELDKQASFELGRQFCRTFLQQHGGGEQRVYKEAGRRDFETLIAQAAAELDKEQQVQQAQQKQASALYDEEYAEKQAEEQGAQAFYTILKQAQDEYQAEQIKLAFEQKVTAIENEKKAAEAKAKELEAKLASQEATMQKKAEEEKRAHEFQAWSQFTVDSIIERLKSESVGVRG